MLASHIPPDDLERLAAVRRYEVLDTPPDGSFDRITALAARMFDVPIAVVTIVDEDRIWFKSRHGLDGITELPRDPGLCASVVCGEGGYVVEHARVDPRTLANPLVAGAFGLQFYAAAPLRTIDGYKLGTLAIIDRAPRPFSTGEASQLEALAAIVMDELELRLATMRAVAHERHERRALAVVAAEHARLYEQEHLVATRLQGAMLPTSYPDVAGLTFDAVYVPAAAEAEVGGDWYDVCLTEPGKVLIAIGDVAGHGLDAAVLMGKLRYATRALALNGCSPRQILQSLDRMLRLEDPEAIVTAFVGIVDLAPLTLECAGAGHPPPLLRTAAGHVIAIAAPGLPLGLRRDDEPESTREEIGVGSMLVLYTDGLTEATRDVIAGEERLHRLLRDDRILRAANPAHAILDGMIATHAPDDIAILTLFTH